MSLAATQAAASPTVLGTLEQQIVKRTWDRVRHLRVERVDGRIVVHGTTPSYHVKQLIIEAIRDLRPAPLWEPVRMRITVRK